MKNIIFIGFLLFLSSCFSLKKELKTAKNGDDVANKIMAATGQKHWQNAKIITWNFQERQHIWDRQRNFHYVKFKETEIWMSLDSMAGIVKIDQEIIEGKKKQKALKIGYKYWANDSFWLNPFSKFFDPGVTRSMVTLNDGRECLAIYYSKGGITPGDTYVWLYDDNYMPSEWKLWVKIIPFNGYKFSWDNWKVVNGVNYSMLHESTFFNIQISNIKTGSRLQELFEIDPFKCLLGS